MQTSMDDKINKMIESICSIFYTQDRNDKVRQKLKAGHDFADAVYYIDIKRPGPVLCFRSEGDVGIGNKECTDCEATERYAQDLEREYRSIFLRLIKAMNNSRDNPYDKSYSKGLIAPLFKYCGKNSQLVVKELKLNTIKLLVKLDLFYWDGEGRTAYDQYGNEIDRYSEEIIEVDIPLDDLANPKRIREAIDKEIYACPIGPYGTDEEDNIFYRMDIDNIDIAVAGFTVDVSSLSRDSIVTLSRGWTGITWHASYQKDQEVISNEYIGSWETFSVVMTEYIRILVLLAVFGLDAELDEAIKLYKTDTALFTHDSNEQKNFEKILDYIKPCKEDDYKTLLCVRSKKGKGDKVYPDYYVEQFTKDKLKEMITSLYEGSSNVITNKELYNRIMQILQVEQIENSGSTTSISTVENAD